MINFARHSGVSVSRYFIKLAYLGTKYHGWQIQDNASSVQETLEQALSTLTGSKIEITGCGRTDTGVHALEYFAHVDLTEDLDRDQMVYKLNKILSRDIAIFSILPVKPDAHARFDAVKRTYEYRILRRKDPFKTELTYYYHGDLDIQSMNHCAAALLEYTDFGAFSKSNTQVNNNLCTINFAGWIEHENEYVFVISANRFLRNMVRAIVGTLLEVGKGKMDIKDFRSVVEGRSRSDAGVSVPASGLFLKSIEYPLGYFDL